MKHNDKKAIVIGAGLGGLSAALSLRAAGYAVTIFEKNSHIGGKLNTHRLKGFTFDLGPSILTLPHVFQELFQRAGKQFESYVHAIPLDLHWRNIFEDGTVVDLHADIEKTATSLGELDPSLPAQFRRFLRYSRRQYDIVNRGYFAKGLDTLGEFVTGYNPFVVSFGLDLLGRMKPAIEKRIDNPYLRDILAYFIKYVGSSALNAPGFMNLMPWVQFGYGCWYVPGGMQGIATGIGKVLDETGVTVETEAEVVRITTAGRKVTGVSLADGRTVQGDLVVSNMEAIPAYRNLLGMSSKSLQRYDRFEPTCSGLVIHLGVKKRFPNLGHHNLFYSRTQDEQFRAVFDRRQIPDDPTLYVVAPTRTDTTLAPKGCEIIKILPQVPYLNDEKPYTREQVAALRDRVLDKMERMGCVGLRESIVVEETWMPWDIQQRYFSNGGSIYGVVSDWRKNYAFKFPKESRHYQGLYFVGGSVNPGGGMPMVILSGMRMADRVQRIEARTEK